MTGLQIFFLHPSLSCSFLSFFFSSVFLNRALKLLHVNQFVVEAVFFIFRDIYKHVQEAHTLRLLPKAL